MEKVKRFASASLLLLVAAVAGAQDKKVETTVALDMVSHYVWRGQDLGSVSLQPTLGIAYKGLSLTAWGSVGIADASDTKEFDITVAYTVGNFNVGVTDYWFNSGLDPENRYFKYSAHETNHVFEANVGYDFGIVSLQWFTNFAGNDGVNGSGKRAYSSYFEANVPFRLAGVEWAATAGVVPYATDFYGTKGFAVTNLALKATKSIRVTDSFAIPIFAQVMANPCARKAYLAFGFTLQP